MSEPHRDRDGWDLQLNGRVSRVPVVKISLKATAKDLRRDSEFLYDLDRDDQHGLCSATTIRRILVVLLVDENLPANVRHDEEAIALMKCAYWKNLRGEAPTPNKSTVRVSIPRAQVFSPAELDRILDALAATNEVPTTA